MVAESRELWPGWETVRLLGRGSFGAVYEIQRSFFSHTEKAALKVISIPQDEASIQEMYQDGYNQESVARHYENCLRNIVKEYALMTEIKGHTNIVYCDDLKFVQHDNGIGWDIYIKMELLQPLTDVIGETVDEHTVIQIGRDICSALALCREKSIVHRDVKPQNIFVSADGNYKLGDFGIARTIEQTTCGAKTGTYKFMAPEVYNLQPYGSRADIYSLGLTLYWLLNERRMPFWPPPPEIPTVSEVESALYQRFSGEQIPPPMHGSEALKRIVLKACAFEPKDRYASVLEMREDLDTLLREMKVRQPQRRSAAVNGGGNGEAVPQESSAKYHKSNAANKEVPAESGEQPALRERAAHEAKALVDKKKRLVPVIAVGVLLVVSLVAALVLKALDTTEASKNAGNPDVQIQQLTQYAESKVWLTDCSMEKTELAGGYSGDHILYYICDIDNDGWLELIIGAFEAWGKTAQCLVYAFIDGQVQLWTTYSYTTEGGNMSISEMKLAAQENYSGFAVYFTIREEDEKYPYMSVLHLEDNNLTEVSTAAGTNEYVACMDREGWQYLSGTPITPFDEMLIKDVAPEELAELTELYEPKNLPGEGGMLKLVDGTVYAVEQTGLYRFVDGQKLTVCTSPAGVYFSLTAGLLYSNASAYVLGTKALADGTQEYQVFRVDLTAGTSEMLFALPGKGTLLKVDDRYIYVQTSDGDEETFGVITVYDHQGKVVKTLVTPQTWDTDGTLVLGLDYEKNCSVVTTDGQYLLWNTTVQDARLIDGSVYYLIGDNMSVTLYRLDTRGNTTTVGILSPCTRASFQQEAGAWVVDAFNGEQETYYGLQLQKVYCVQEVMTQLPDTNSIAYIDFAQDAVTGQLYLLTTYAPHGNSGPLYRLEDDGQFELLRAKEEEIFYWLFYNNMVYYGTKDYSEAQSYVGAPMVANCMSVEALSE